jgi:hypothetical protein
MIMEGEMRLVMASSFAIVLVNLAAAPPAAAHTCSEHHDACVRYGHGAIKCGCARRVCQKKVGSGDAGPRWNWIAGINACFQKK